MEPLKHYQYSGNEPALSQTAFGVDISAQIKKEVLLDFNTNIPDSQAKVYTKISGTVTQYEKNSDATAYAKAENGRLYMETPPGVGDEVAVVTRLHPRFVPNDGKKFANSNFFLDWLSPNFEYEVGFMNFDDATMVMDVSITLLVREGKAYFRIVSNGLEKEMKEIPKSLLESFGLGDLAKGHLFDIQAQLRNVGDIILYMSHSEHRNSRPIFRFLGLNNQDDVTVSQTAMHGGFIIRKIADVPGEPVVGRYMSGCAVIENEGTVEQPLDPIVASNALDVTSVPARNIVGGVETGGAVLLAVRCPEKIGTILNTRDSIILDINVESDKKGDVEIYIIDGDSRLKKSSGPSVPLENTDWITISEGNALQQIDNSSGLITEFDRTGIRPYKTKGVLAGGVATFKPVSTDKAPENFTHGQVLVIVGYANIATMRCQDANFGEKV